jgi:FOG: TPR repeat, SEL1 subfamily
MLRLPCKIIALTYVLCFLFASPQVQACMGADMEDTLFFNTNDRPFFVDNLGQKPSEAKGLVELPPDAEVIAEVILVGDNRIKTAAKIVHVTKTTNPRVRQDEEIAIKYMFTSCGPSHGSGDQGTIVAKVGTDIEDRLVLCLYSRRFSDGSINSPIGSEYISECRPDEIEAARQIKQAAENGDVKAQIALGLMYEEGRSVRQNGAEALKWFQSAVKNGDAEAQYAFGQKHQRDKNGKEALKWFELAAAQGQAEAMYAIGRMYEYGNYGIKQSDVESDKWYAHAAEHGNERAEPKLAAAKKMEALKPAAKRGEAEAQFKLGRMYYDRWQGPEAAKWYKLAAAQGQTRAMNELGYLYQVGAAGVTLDYAEAEKWYRLGTKQGDAYSQFSLGQMYRLGYIAGLETCAERSHCPRNKQAVEWYRRAAEQGYSQAQYMLGRMYQEGEGLTRNDAEAVKYYRLAVEQGNTLAKEFLTQMYLQGRGIDGNDAEAVEYLRQAAGNGNERARGRLEALQKPHGAQRE